MTDLGEVFRTIFIVVESGLGVLGILFLIDNFEICAF